METHENRVTLGRWADRIEALGLQGICGALLDVARPLAPIGAGVLWGAQPTLGLFFGHRGRDEVARWAGVLEDPETLAWLSERLLGEERDDCE